jgi:hypothetical protein
MVRAFNVVLYATVWERLTKIVPFAAALDSTRGTPANNVVEPEK